MLEVLIAVLILSFALLGLTGLQVSAQQANYEARRQSDGVSLARELAEMMRGNKDLALQDDATNPYVGAFTSPLTARRAGYCLRPGSQCSVTTDTAAAQMTDWLARVDAAFPGARVVVCSDTQPYSAEGVPQWPCRPGAGAMLTVKIGWTTRSLDGNPEPLRATAAESVPLVVVPLIPGNV